MSQKFSEPGRGPCVHQRGKALTGLAADNLRASWEALFAGVVPKTWAPGAKSAAECLFYTGAACAYELLILKAEASAGGRNAAARRVMRDLQFWLKKFRKSNGLPHV